MNELKFLVDECVGSAVSDWLSLAGYDSISVIDVMSGAKDEAVLNKALRENRILVTYDKDFGDLVFFKKSSHCGVILLRIQSRTIENKIKALGNLLQNYTNDLNDNFIVISNAGIRVRSPQHAGGLTAVSSPKDCQV